MTRDATPLLIVGAAALAAIAAPALLLTPRAIAPETQATGPERTQPIVVSDSPQMGGIVARRPFGDTRPLVQADSGADAATDKRDDGPDLAGIVGRFPRHAQAMVRIGQGRTRTLSPGQSIDGWKLVTLTPSRATFRRGSRRVVRRVN
jgi:hypothetical protein